jgi:hypothetical protein
MASLLAVNGAGLLGIKDLPLTVWSAVSAGSFYIGIAGSLLIAWFGQKAAQAMLAPLSELIGFWTITAVSGEFSADLHRQIIEKVEKSMTVGRRSGRAGWIAFLAFTAGIICAGVAVASGEMQKKVIAKSVVSLTTPNATRAK